jgi:hypothetical protein
VTQAQCGPSSVAHLDLRSSPIPLVPYKVERILYNLTFAKFNSSTTGQHGMIFLYTMVQVQYKGRWSTTGPSRVGLPRGWRYQIYLYTWPCQSRGPTVNAPHVPILVAGRAQPRMNRKLGRRRMYERLSCCEASDHVSTIPRRFRRWRQ